jgi:DNA-binding Lrp family transcriptional regulator
MYDVDETDVRILGLMAEDGRRPYSEIAERVDLSPPAVSDRVDRLREEGIISRFTVDIDRSALRDAEPVLVEVDARPTAVDRVRSALAEAPAVEHVFTTDNARVVCFATVPSPVRGWLLSVVDPDDLLDYHVDAVEAVDWRVTVADGEFGLSCVECADTVTGEGVTARVAGEVRQFCSPSCETRFRERTEDVTDADPEPETADD